MHLDFLVIFSQYVRAGPYPGLSLGTTVLRKCWTRLYKRYIVIHLNRLELQMQAYTRSLTQQFLSVLLKGYLRYKTIFCSKVALTV